MDKTWNKERTKRGKFGIGGTGVEGEERILETDIKKLQKTIDNIHVAVTEGGMSLCPDKEFDNAVGANWTDLPQEFKEKYLEISKKCRPDTPMIRY